MRIQLLWWEGCPSHPEALGLLEQVLADRGLEFEIEQLEVRTEEEAETLGFVGSPTILVDGRDVDDIGAKGRPSLTCRIYHLDDGRVSPVPSRRQIEDALR